jgi:hypothetical protein
MTVAKAAMTALVIFMMVFVVVECTLVMRAVDVGTCRYCALVYLKTLIFNKLNPAETHQLLILHRNMLVT